MSRYTRRGRALAGDILTVAEIEQLHRCGRLSLRAAKNELKRTLVGNMDLAARRGGASDETRKKLCEGALALYEDMVERPIETWPAMMIDVGRSLGVEIFLGGPRAKRDFKCAACKTQYVLWSPVLTVENPDPLPEVPACCPKCRDKSTRAGVN